MKTRIVLRVGLVLLTGLLGAAITVGNVARAGPIGLGFDLFSTPMFTSNELSAVFGQMVELVGKPVGPGNTDTIVQRMGPDIPAGALGSFDIKLVDLSLRSVMPVNLQGSFFDLMLVLDPNTMSVGRLDITSHNDPGGGLFDSFFDVFADVCLTPVGGGPTTCLPLDLNPGTTQIDPLHLAAAGSSWSHTPPPGYPMDPRYPSGGFYPGPIDHQGQHPVIPGHVVPVPATLPLVLAGLAIGALIRRRRAQV